MGLNIYRRIMKKKYTATEAVIVLAIYMVILIGYTLFMV
jgi:hypothetical protein